MSVVFRRRALARILAAAALGAAAVGALGTASCLAPTLPVPPPSQPDVIGPDPSGNVTLKGSRGSARPNAEVTAWNPNLNAGRGAGVVTIAADDGSWSQSIPAKSKEILWVWQSIGFERSDRIEVKIP